MSYRVSNSFELAYVWSCEVDVDFHFLPKPNITLWFVAEFITTFNVDLLITVLCRSSKNLSVSRSNVSWPNAHELSFSSHFICNKCNLCRPNFCFIHFVGTLSLSILVLKISWILFALIRELCLKSKWQVLTATIRCPFTVAGKSYLGLSFLYRRNIAEHSIKPKKIIFVINICIFVWVTNS